MAQIVEALVQQQLSRPVEVFFVDESHFTNEPYVQRGWFRKGMQTRMPQPVTRQSATVFGALHLRTQRFYWKRATRGTSKGLIEFLHQLHQRFPEALLVLILDNATIHKSHVIKRFLKRHVWIQFEHLTPYSPEYNPIERFWQWLKAKVYGASAFETIKEVMDHIRKLVWHYNEGRLQTTIHFDFIPYAKIL